MVIQPRPSDFAKKRTDKIVEKIRAAMALIEAELKKNKWLYESNGGRLSQAELCRRAGVAQVTLQNPSHKDSTLPWVNRWLKKIRSKMITGRNQVRKTVSANTNRWKAEYNKVTTNYHLSRLEMVGLKAALADSKAEVDKAKQTIAEQAQEIRQLRVDLSEGKVVRHPKAKQKVSDA